MPITSPKLSPGPPQPDNNAAVFQGLLRPVFRLAEPVKATRPGRRSRSSRNDLQFAGLLKTGIGLNGIAAYWLEAELCQPWISTKSWTVFGQEANLDRKLLIQFSLDSG